MDERSAGIVHALAKLLAKASYFLGQYSPRTFVNLSSRVSALWNCSKSCASGKGSSMIGQIKYPQLCETDCGCDLWYEACCHSLESCDAEAFLYPLWMPSILQMRRNDWKSMTAPCPQSTWQYPNRALKPSV